MKHLGNCIRLDFPLIKYKILHQMLNFTTEHQKNIDWSLIIPNHKKNITINYMKWLIRTRVITLELIYLNIEIMFDFNYF